MRILRGVESERAITTSITAAAAPPTKHKNPGTALAIGPFIAGAGHMYPGEWGRGILILIGALLVGSVSGSFLGFYGWIVIILYWIWQMVDCGQTFKKKYPCDAANF